MRQDTRLEWEILLLLRREASEEYATVLSRQLRTQLIARTIHEAQNRYQVRPEWRRVTWHLAGWLDQHADDLPALVDAETANIHDWQEATPPAQSLTSLRNLIADNSADYDAPGNADYRRQSAAYAAYDFFDLLLARRDPGAVSELLVAFGTAGDWSGVLQAMFGLATGD